MFIALTAYACATKRDFTYFGGALSVASMMIVVIAIIFSFFVGKIGWLIIIGILTVLLSIWIIYDTQLIVGGKHRAAELELDDYIIGAIIIYSDIVTAFIYILQLIGLSTE